MNKLQLLSLARAMASGKRLPANSQNEVADWC
jgi:hypothetical protein